MSLFAELKRRNVFKVGIAYMVASWLLLQLTEVLTELLELSTDMGKIVIVLLVIGFVPALIFAWAFEMTPEGIKKEKDVDRSQSITPQTGRKLDFIIIGMLVLIAGYFIWEARFKQDEPIAEPVAAVESQAAPDVSADMLIRFSSGTTTSCVLATSWTERAKEYHAWPEAAIEAEGVLI